MKRVLFVSYIFAPMIGGGVYRVTQTSKYLPQFGWLPTVLTVPTDQLIARDEKMLDELPPEVEIVRVRCPLMGIAAPYQPNRRAGAAGYLRALKRYISRMVFIPDWKIVWYPWAVSAGKKLLASQRYDAILATYGPATNMIIAARLARLAKLPLILDFRDIWVDDPVAEWPTPLHKLICRWLERRLVRQASQVIGVTEPMAQLIAKRHQVEDQNVHCITNGFDPENFARVHDSRNGVAGDRAFRLCLAGAVYGHGLRSLFESIAALAAEGRITPRSFRLEFVGNMTIDEPQQFGIADFVEVHPPVPHEQVFDFFARSDVLLLVEMVGYNVHYSFPSKLFDYMLAGKPILALAEEGELTSRVVRELGGVVVHPEDGAGIRAALEKLIAARSAPMRDVDITREPWRQFNRRILTERMAGVLDAAIAEEPAK